MTDHIIARQRRTRIITPDQKREFFHMLDHEIKQSPLYSIQVEPEVEEHQDFELDSYFEMSIGTSFHHMHVIQHLFANHPDWKNTFYRYTKATGKSNLLICRINRMLKFLEEPVLTATV